jgi:hypothetical protein
MSQDWRIIFVGEKPYRVWPGTSSFPNSFFLEGLNHRYFSVLADIFEEALGRDDAWAVRLALRTIYGQALESFFSVLFATLQAPLDPVAWLLLYRSEDLTGLLKRFEEGKELPTFVVLPEPRNWESLAEIFHPVADEIEGGDKIVEKLAAFWRRLAEEMLDPVASAEFNSLKHGFRTQASGHHVFIGGVQAIESDYGSRFPMVERKNSNVFVRMAGRTWSPETLCATLRLVSSSIGNLLTVLRQLNSQGLVSPLVLEIPSEEEFSAAEPKLHDFSSFTIGPQWIEGGKKPSPVDKHEALHWYREFSCPLVVRRREEKAAPNSADRADD